MRSFALPRMTTLRDILYACNHSRPCDRPDVCCYPLVAQGARSRDITYDIREGTWMTVDVSADGIVYDGLAASAVSATLDKR